jgi:hypothetical protein
VLILDRVRLHDKTYRIVPSKYPAVSFFESCAHPQDLESLYLLEGLTNSRLRQEVGILSRVAEDDRISGPGSTAIMASFTHVGMASRFTDGSYGVYYAGLDLPTAIAESKYWQALQMADVEGEEPFARDMRVYCAAINGQVSDLVDLRQDSRVQHPVLYGESQSIGRALRDDGEYGLVYRSVRVEDGQCLAAFRPPIVGSAFQSHHLRYYWDGAKIERVEKVINLQ